jgi:hypothetical protein
MALYATNGYALRAYAEHPIELWPMDDNATYLTLISETQRDMSQVTQWTPNAQTSITTVSSNTLFAQEIPFKDSVINKIDFSSTPQSGYALGATSSDLFSYSLLNQDKKSFSVNMYVFTSVASSKISRYEFGITYIDSITSDEITIPGPTTYVVVPNEWMRLSYTVDIPQDSWSNIVMYFNIYLDQPVDTGQDYAFYVNGLSIGQWSEWTSDKTQGAVPENLPQNVQNAINSGSITQGVEAKAYGLSENNGYYLIQNNELLSTTYGIPMVYGSDNCTRIYPSSDGSPSIVFPGLGFLNQNGGSNKYTAEFWLRIDNNGRTTQKIWGPTYSDNGLYVGNGCIALVINGEFLSYAINDWYRPMLVSVILSNGNASLSLNGEVVITIPYQFDKLEFPNIDQDWIGFYGNDQFSIFEIDCFGIYPYVVPSEVSKRRFVWGQGVSSPEDINSAFQGTTAYVDYAFAGYDASYKYPGNGRWDAGTSNNLDTEKQFIKNPEYVLPQLYVGGNRSEQEFLEYNKQLQVVDTQPFFYFQPDPLGGTPFTDPVYMTWGDFSPINDDVKSFYTIFEGVEEITGDEYQPLFSITNTVTGYTFDAILLAGTSIENVKLTYRYYLTINPLNPDDVILKQFELPYNDSFVCGFNIDNLYSQRYGTVQDPITNFFDFFSNPNNLRVQVGSDGVNTFTGKTYAIGYSNEYNTDVLNLSADIDEILVLANIVTGINTATVTTKAPHHFINGQSVTIRNTGIFNGTYTIQSILSDTQFTFYIAAIPANNPFVAPIGATASCSYFNNDGFTNIYNDGSLYEQMGSYTLLPKLNFNQFYFDIGFNGYWQETYPLSYFAQPARNLDDSIYLDLDLMQFNISYPSNYSVDVSSGSNVVFTYEELENEYATPVQRNYRDLDANFFTYGNLKNNTNNSLDYYNFSDSDARFFISFQYAQASNILSINQIETFYGLNTNEVIDPSFLNNQLNVGFEIKDRVVIYPPTNTSLERMVMVLYVNINSKGIVTSPFQIRQMSIISKSFNNNSRDRFNTIGTRFGVDLYSYQRTPFFFDTQARIPYGVYTESTPYLYLTKYSGTQVIGSQTPGVETGIAMPINADRTPNFKITGAQLWLKYSEDFPTVPTTLFNIWHPSGIIYFDIEKDGESNRGIISIRSTNTNLANTSLFSIFQNGIQVKDFYLEKDKWTVLGMNFGKEISFLSVIGYLNTNYGAVFDNVSFYQSTQQTENSAYIYQIWNEVLYYWENNVELQWSFWKPQTWDNVLRRFAGGKIGINPYDLVSVYFGTNRKVVDDNTGLQISNTFSSSNNPTKSSIVYTDMSFDTSLH